jgi:alginate O-acetyltransferase complex protein AlgI
MIFNSFSFIFAFLPITLIGYFFLSRESTQWAAVWLTLASLLFYGWWDYHYLPLLLGSILFNYWTGWRIAHSIQPLRKRWLMAAITVNLLLLGYFKYADFFIISINNVTGGELPALKVILPIGISFFTFTQIAFLVDTYQDKVKEFRFIHYSLFVTYFPHLIAGPVLHHKEMMPQFADDENYKLNSTLLN